MAEKINFEKILEKERKLIEQEQEKEQNAQENLPKIIERFTERHKLDPEQVDAFVKYYHFLMENNENFNLTAKTTPSGVFNHLFSDSLALIPYINWDKTQSIADIGSGAGFPGIPLKILKPEIKLFLVEVNKKKQVFLREVCDLLGLENVEIIDTDWRTFNRKTNYAIDFFISKATFNDDEIVRMFRKNCHYFDKFLVYWASLTWVPDEKFTSFVKKTTQYKNGQRYAKFAFFSETPLEKHQQIRS